MLLERFVTASDGTTLYCASEGDGPALVLCDGIGCDGFIWKHLRRHLLPRYKIVHWHYRGHGYSQRPEDLSTLTIDQVCDDLDRVVDAFALDRFVLAGHSMGVQIVLQYALHHLQRVRGVIPALGSYRKPLTTFHGRSTAHDLFPLLHGAIRRFPRVAQGLWGRVLPTELAYQVATRMEVNGKLVRRADFEPYFEHLAGMDIRVFFGMLADLDAHDLESELPHIDVPCLVVGGERDTFTPAWLSTRMAQLMPQAELLMMPSGTHTALIEIPELFHLRVDRFLAGLAP
jgi:pimeloyl-ACP methyl ester carboxylesterase